MRKYAVRMALAGVALAGLLAGCDGAKPVDPKPAGPPDTRLKPAENGKSAPAPAPAVRGD